MHHVTMRMPTHARINSTNQDGAVHVKLNIIPKSLELARSVGREESNCQPVLAMNIRRRKKDNRSEIEMLIGTRDLRPGELGLQAHLR